MEDHLAEESPLHQQLQGPEDRCAPHSRDIGTDLLGGEIGISASDALQYPKARGREPVALALDGRKQIVVSPRFAR